MILNTGLKTDIPAFYSDWFFNRVEAGYVDVYDQYRSTVSSRTFRRYQINHDVVDAIGFTTKNPAPMLADSRFPDFVHAYKTVWYMTITPYGTDIEPNVPDLTQSVQTFKNLVVSVPNGKNVVAWRYDPILYGNGWDMQYHIRAFKDIANALAGYTKMVVVSFVEHLGEMRNAQGVFSCPDINEQITMVTYMNQVALSLGMKLYVCHGDKALSSTGAIISNCASLETMNNMMGTSLYQKKKSKVRNSCYCMLSNDIGAYDTCMHFCKYCYACSNPNIVHFRHRMHDSLSSTLIGTVGANDTVIPAKQETWNVNRMITDAVHRGHGFEKGCDLDKVCGKNQTREKRTKTQECDYDDVESEVHGEKIVFEHMGCGENHSDDNSLLQRQGIKRSERSRILLKETCDFRTFCRKNRIYSDNRGPRVFHTNDACELFEYYKYSFDNIYRLAKEYYGVHFDKNEAQEYSCALIDDYLCQNRKSIKDINIQKFENMCVNAFSHMSKSAFLFIQDCDDNLLTCGDITFDNANFNLLRHRMKQMIGTLSEKQQKVIYYRYYEDYGYVEIGDIMGMSRSRVHQIHNKALHVLRGRFCKELEGFLI